MTRINLFAGQGRNGLSVWALIDGIENIPCWDLRLTDKRGGLHDLEAEIGRVDSEGRLIDYLQNNGSLRVIRGAHAGFEHCLNETDSLRGLSVEISEGDLGRLEEMARAERQPVAA